MQDRFKFKAYHKPTNKIYDVYGFNEHFVFIDTLDTCEPLKTEDCILLQCTGIKDKNGKLIFEGDIVKITDKSSRKEPFIGVVEYTKIASYEANCNGFYMYLHDPKTPENISMVEKMFCTSLREIEVIGNIHENPELLENKNAS